ncbi:L-threonylcarbamoyladenylate synthase [Sphingomonas sp.]|uniref:L-threonylcarbamoyladenylate synthase n=1 Tax=Sphingomonas sp. TaxID=28214 RepID=UPI0018033501|nr:L-threonylcarbamoyladenylate synthase [Sphingomonas sp.]MBA3511470.1 threonylcarbamoyl-AMP synthase [Sphingomonas sp.]
MTRVAPFSDDAIGEAAELVRSGEPVAIATETVYGLAADATNAAAVARIYEAKGRPRFNPLIVHVPDLGAAGRIGELGPEALELARQHWPGPLTLVVPLKADAGIASLVTAGLATIALRVPSHRAMQALLRATGRPLAAPSANASGSISPTRAEHVLQSLDGKIELIVDDGPCGRGIESTIVAATGGALRLLRPGPILVDAPAGFGEAIESPGQLQSHYAPSKPLRLEVIEAASDEYLIGFGPVAGDSSLSRSGDSVEAAARLFDLLHFADMSPKPRIAVAPVPGEGLGIAINDRLRRAAGRRD